MRVYDSGSTTCDIVLDHPGPDAVAYLVSVTRHMFCKEYVAFAVSDADAIDRVKKSLRKVIDITTARTDKEEWAKDFLYRDRCKQELECEFSAKKLSIDQVYNVSYFNDTRL